MMPPHSGRLQSVLVLSTLLAGPTADTASAEAVVELRVGGGESHSGRLVAKGRDAIILEDRAGRFAWVPTPDVVAYRKHSTYRPYSSIEFKDALLREFGRDREVASSRHFVVCGPAGRTRGYVRLLDEIYASFERFFRIRGVRLHEPAKPMPMIVFPNRKEFDRYAVANTGGTSPTLMGFYYPRSNRVALFEQRDYQDRVDTERTRDTLIHEATHQLAFNCGMHARLGVNPKWIVEGIAMVFESPGVRTRQPSARPSSRVNVERLMHFRARPRPEGAHLALVRGDRRFETAALDAYAESWALTFYLLEKRSVAYARYLQKIAARDPHAGYSAEEREADFLEAFGKNTGRFENDYLKFVGRLKL